MSRAVQRCHFDSGIIKIIISILVKYYYHKATSFHSLQLPVAVPTFARPCITGSSEINLIMAEFCTDDGLVVVAVASPDRNTESSAIVAEASSARSTEPLEDDAAAGGTVPRPPADLMCQALVKIFADKASPHRDQLLPVLQRRTVFSLTDADLPIFDKFKELVGHYKWIPTVPACQKALAQFDRYLGGRITGATAKVPNLELYRPDAVRMTTLWKDYTKSQRNSDHYQRVLEMKSSSDDSQSQSPEKAGAPVPSKRNRPDDSQSQSPAQAGAPAPKKLKGPMPSRRALVLNTDAYYAAPADTSVSIGAPIETHGTSTVSSPGELSGSIDWDDLTRGFNQTPPEDVVSLAAPRSVASTVVEPESDGAPADYLMTHDSSSRYDARQDRSDAESEYSSYSDSGSRSSYSSYSVSPSSYSYYSYSSSDSCNGSPGHSPAKTLKRPPWCAVDTADIRPEVQTTMQSMIALLKAEPIDVTRQYAPKKKAAGKRQAKTQAKKKSKAKGKAKPKAKARGKAIANVASTPTFGAPEVGSLATPSIGAPVESSIGAPVRYGCPTCRNRPFGTRCKDAKGIVKKSCIKRVKV